MLYFSLSEGADARCCQRDGKHQHVSLKYTSSPPSLLDFFLGELFIVALRNIRYLQVLLIYNLLCTYVFKSFDKS